jgi:hypothetical protein
VANRDDEFVGFSRLLVNFFLNRGVFLIDHDGRNRMGEGIGKLASAVRVIFPAEHLVDDAHIAEQVGDRAVMRLAFDVVE